MREVITISLLTISSVIGVIVLVNSIFPSVYQVSASVSSISATLNEKIRTNIDIIFVIGDNSTNTVSLWIKNTGSSKISGKSIEMSDLFIYNTSIYKRIPYNTGTRPYWIYTIENDDGDGYWDRGETINVTAYLDFDLHGDYNVVFILYNGASDKDTFSVG